jgi:hypothetical protein
MTTKKVGNQRLLKLAAFLEKLPPKRFDYGSFVGDSWQGKPDLSCGTTACAMGWAVAMPEFKRLGFVLGQSWGFPIVKNRQGHFIGFYDAGTTMFGLSNDDYDALFIPNSAAAEKYSAKTVAKKIRAFVKARA